MGCDVGLAYVCIDSVCVRGTRSRKRAYKKIREHTLCTILTFQVHCQHTIALAFQRTQCKQRVDEKSRRNSCVTGCCAAIKFCESKTIFLRVSPLLRSEVEGRSVEGDATVEEIFDAAADLAEASVEDETTSGETVKDPGEIDGGGCGAGYGGGCATDANFTTGEGIERAERRSCKRTEVFVVVAEDSPVSNGKHLS